MSIIKWRSSLKKHAKTTTLISIFPMAKSKPLEKMAPLLGKPKEFLKIPKPTKNLNLRFFLFRKEISNVNEPRFYKYSTI